MNKKDYSKELAKQAQYDFETAEAMFKAGRNIYCVFMCHLAIEKMLKVLYNKSLSKIPPKVHSLVYLVQAQKLKLSKNLEGFLENLDNVSVPTRYPDELDKLIAEYDKKRTHEILRKSNEVLKCLKEKFEK